MLVELGGMRLQAGKAANAGTRKKGVVDWHGNVSDRYAAGDNRIKGHNVLGKRVDVRSRRGKSPTWGAVSKASGIGLEDAVVGDPGIVALHGDVQAVFQRELDGVLQTDMQLAIGDELIDSRRIREHGRFDAGGLVGLEDIGKNARALTVTVFREAQGCDGSNRRALRC